jgi:hypothetical protein
VVSHTSFKVRDKPHFVTVKAIGRCQNSDGLWTGQPGFDSQQCKIFLFSVASRRNLGPTQPHIQGVPWALFPKSKVAKEANHSPPAIVEVKKDGAMPPLPLTPS